MTKRQGPGLYTDIGRNIRGLLYQDFSCSPKFSITVTNSNQHDAITCVGTKKNDSFYVGVGTFSKEHSTMTYAKLNIISKKHEELGPTYSLLSYNIIDREIEEYKEELKMVAEVEKKQERRHTP